MKPFKGSVVHAVKDYWTRFMHSVKNHRISRGAANFAKTITKPFKDNWRRKEVKKAPHNNHK